MNIFDAIQDDRFFRPLFKDLDTWTSWLVFLHALFGIPVLNAGDKKILRQCTGLKQSAQMPVKEAYVIAGRRSGKSWISAIIACYMAMFKDWSKFLSPGERGYIFIVSVDRNQSSIIKRYISGIMHSNKRFEKMIENETVERIDLTNQISIMIKTASYRSIRGFTVCVALLDEMAFFRSEESANPDVEVIAALRPCLSTIPESLMISISTPYSRRGVLFDQYRSHFGEGKETLIWKAPTVLMNPTINEQLIAKAKKEDPISARAEWDADFRDDVVSFLPLDLIEKAVIPNRLELPRLNGVAYHGFLDPSGGRRDSMTLAISHKDPEKDKIIVDLVREAKAPFKPEDVVAEFSELLKRYDIYYVETDRYGEAWVENSFRNHGIAIEQAKFNKSEIYLNFLPLLSNESIELLDNQRLVTQLRNLERHTRSGGRDHICHPKGLHDDVCNSVCGSIVRTYGHSNIIRDRIQYGIMEEIQTPEGALQAETTRWLLDLPPKKKREVGFDDEELLKELEIDVPEKNDTGIYHGW